MSALKKILKNVYVFSVISRALIVVAGFLYSILLARYLGAELKGQLAYINTITAITVIVFSFGMHQAYPYYKKQGKEGIERTYVHVCFLVLGVYVLLSVAAAAIIGAADERVRIAVLLTPLLTFAKLVTYQAMVEKPNRRNAWEMICEFAEVAVLALFLLFAKRSLYYCIALIAVKNIVSCVYYLHLTRVDLKFEKNDVVMAKEFAAFGFLPMLSLLMNNLNYRIDVLMLGHSVPDSQIGIYSVGIQIAEKVWLLSDALRDVLFSKLIRGKDAEEVNKVIRICFTISAVIDVCIIALGRPFIRICYGSEFEGAYTPLVIVLFGTLVMVYYKIIQAYNIVHRKQKINFVFLGISVVVNVVLNALFIPRFGINGAAAASLASYTICALLFAAEYAKATGTHIKDLLFVNREDVRLIADSVKKKTKQE